MYTFIANPNARSGRGILLWKQIEKILLEKEIAYNVLFTKYQHHATRLVHDLTSDGAPHTIVVLGGDGTLNEVIDGIRYLDKVTLGYIPLGSGKTLPEVWDFRRTSTVLWNRFFLLRITPP